MQNLVKPNAKLEDIKRVNNEEPMPAHMLNKIQNQKSDPSQNVNNNNQQLQGQKPPSSNNANLPKPQQQPQSNLLFQKQPNSQNNIVNTPSSIQRQPSSQNNIVNTPPAQQKREEPSNQAKQNYHYKNTPSPQPGIQQPQQQQAQPYQGPKIVDASKFEKNSVPALSRANEPKQADNKNIVPQQKFDANKQYVRNPTADPKQPIQDQFAQKRYPDQKIAENKPNGQPLSLEKYNWLDNNNGAGNKPESKQDARFNLNAGNAAPNNNPPALNRNKWINNPIPNDPVKVSVEVSKSPSQQDIHRRDGNQAKIERPSAQIIDNQPIKYNVNQKQQAPVFKNMAERDILGGFGGGVGGANIRPNNNNKDKKGPVLQDNFMKEKQQNSNEKQIQLEKQKLIEFEKKRFEEEKVKKDKNMLEEKKRKEKVEQERLENQKKREEERKSMLDEINRKRVIKYFNPHMYSLQGNSKKQENQQIKVEWLGGVKPYDSSENDANSISTASSRSNDKVSNHEKEIYAKPEEFNRPAKVEKKKIVYKPPPSQVQVIEESVH